MARVGCREQACAGNDLREIPSTDVPNGGPQAALDFFALIQHQSPDFRRKVLPKLKKNVDAGQADPRSHATMLDRTKTDAGEKQLYGENLVCSVDNPKLHLAPIEDERHVNERRATIGLLRLELCVQLVVARMPDFCRASTEVK
jgi:hypothetical protein